MGLDLGKAIGEAFASFSDADRAAKVRNELKQQLKIYAERVNKTTISTINCIAVTSDEDLSKAPTLSLIIPRKNSENILIKAEFSTTNDEIRIVTKEKKIPKHNTTKGHTIKQTAEEKFSYGSEQECLGFFITQSLKYMTANDRVLLKNALQGERETPDVSETTENKDNGADNDSRATPYMYSPPEPPLD